jgi:formamidopyrimidine-DNA glycosylase
MVDNSPYRLWSMAGELNSSIVGSRIKKAFLPHWLEMRYKKNKQLGISPLFLRKWRFETIENYGKSIILKLERDGDSLFIGCDPGNGSWITQEKTSSFYKCSDSVYVFFEMVHPLGFEYNLIFYDKRRRGKLEIRPNVHDIQLLNRYGPAIDSPYFTKEWLDFVFKSRVGRLHKLLTRQKYFAGMTNRMISEICYLANIPPTIAVHQITEEQSTRLYHSILVVFASFSRIKRKHEYMVWAKIDCSICESKIVKDRVENFITFYCPVCQHPDFRNPQPISEEFVNEILKISTVSASVKTSF